MLTDAIRTVIMEKIEMSRCLRARLILPAILAQETNGLSLSTRTITAFPSCVRATEADR